MNIGLLRFISIDPLTLMACFAAGIGLCFFLCGFRLFARKQSPEHISTTTILAAAPGPTSISGIAAGPFTLSAPITGQRCYLHQTTVWQPSGSGRKQAWEKVAEETLHLPFFIEDATGQLLVEPLGAQLDLAQNFCEEYGQLPTPLGPENIPPRVSAFLARHGITLDRTTRIEERSIQPETPLFIAGTLAENPNIPLRPLSPGATNSQHDHLCNKTNGNSEPASRPEIVRLSSGPVPSSTLEMTQQGKIAAALSRAGITKPEAWADTQASIPEVSSPGVAVEDRTQPDADSAPELSAAPAADQANDQTNDPTAKDQTKPDARFGFNLTPPLVLMKGADNPLFAISSPSQPKLVSFLGWKSVAMVVGGASLAVLGLVILLLERQLR